MNWDHIAQGVSDVLCIVLITRLLTLRLHRVYRVFCLFLVFELAGSLIYIVEKNLPPEQRPDYRITWIGLEISLCVLSLWMVYALLIAILAGLPGILKFSRKLLNVIFASALAFAFWSGWAEFGISKALSFITPLGRDVGETVILYQAICTAALIALLAILLFILWFPVQMPRNLAVFSIGFVIYFAATGASLMTWSLSSRVTEGMSDRVLLVVLSLCYLYWTLFITPRGEERPVRIGHSWHPAQQQVLLDQLTAMNASLLHAAQSDAGPLIPSAPQR